MATEKKTLVNEQITAEQVRLINAGGEQVGVMSLARAMQEAGNADLDLVEISPNAEPPVCRLMDYGKFLYNASKKKHSARKKQKNVGLKEVKFRPGTDDHDYDIKLRKLRGFLADGNKTKVTLRFRGREMAHPELGTEMLVRVRTDLAETSVVEQEAKQEGRQMVMVLAPRKSQPNTKKTEDNNNAKNENQSRRG